MHAIMSRIIPIPQPSSDPCGATRADCTNCGCDLAFHLPDPMRPLRMLATCEVCGSWFLVDADREKPEAVMVQLPDYGCNWAAMRN
jgi:hypothetical protein